jgi:hypothetical protein
MNEHGMHIDGVDENIARKVKVEAVKCPTKEFTTCRYRVLN